MEQDNLKMDILKLFTKLKKTFSSNKPDEGITVSEYILLYTILDNNEKDSFGNYVISSSKLAKELSMSGPALTKATKKLVKLGLIMKEQSLLNLRSKTITLTGNGLKALEEEKEHTMYVPDKIVDKLGEEETNHLIKLLNDVTNVVDSINSPKEVKL